MAVPYVKTRALCIVNPSAAGRNAGTEDLESMLDTLAAAGFEVELSECALPHPTAEELVGRAIAAGMKAVIAAGGDATVQAAARSIMKTDVVLGILPFGRSNNIARGLGIPVDPPGAARVIAARHVRKMDVGEVSGQLFFETAGVGVDAEAFGAARAAERGRWRGAIRRTWRALRQGSHRLRIVGPKGERRIRAKQALVLNSPFYAWALPVVPDASMHDGLLDLAVFPRHGLAGLMKTLLAMTVTSEPSERPVVIRDREFTIDARVPLTVHADGRVVGKLPATFRCLPGAVSVYAPKR